MRARSLRAVSWLVGVALVGCLGPIEQMGERYRHRQHGFALTAPAGADGPWERVEVPGATLAFRGPQDDTVVVKSRCGRPVARPQLMARHLARGLLAIVKLDDNYELVPAAVADKIDQRDATYLVLRNQPQDGVEDEEDPYADYKIPDDLMW